MQKLINLTEIALMAALIAVCAWVTVPTSVPFTLQTFGVFLALCSLGSLKGSASVALYILIGAAGAPVFSGFKGGAGVLLGPTGGYITGFLAICVFYALGERFFGKSRVTRIVSLAAGLAACYAAGTFWFARVMSTGGSAMTVLQILSVCVFPFIIPDCVKLAAAALVAERITKLLPKAPKKTNKSAE